jgi:hypothetical protein
VSVNLDNARQGGRERSIDIEVVDSSGASARRYETAGDHESGYGSDDESNQEITSKTLDRILAETFEVRFTYDGVRTGTVH